ncbi:hypothetical protein ACFPC0_29630 [Streptomyces andamanensis]|uniref:Uncharacterized protein n=2 Tax=Streptomyces TaxID=1883 RepID=A0ABV8TMA4_9ACTN
MAPDNQHSAARIALLKAALAAVGVVFFLIALFRSAHWAYAVGAFFLITSATAGLWLRPRPHRPDDHTHEHNKHPPRPE